MFEEVKERIKKHEGFVNKIYLDSLGKATIGYGHLITSNDSFEEGVEYSKELLDEVFNRDFLIAKRDADELLQDISIVEQAHGIIIEMVFQLGKTGVSKFKKMFTALSVGDYNEAANQMLDSQWRKQTPKRCEELAEQMRSC
jgi:GH24 family phage-related lysozyme (muramidase)